MDDARQNETLRVFVMRRESELLRQLAALREQIAPAEAELKEIQNTKALLGITAEPEPYVPLEADLRAFLRPVVSLKPHLMTQKQLILRAFLDRFAGGAAPSQLVDYIRDNYDVAIESGSLRPQLARLRDDGLVVHDQSAGLWLLHPTAQFEFARILDEADQVKVREMSQVAHGVDVRLMEWAELNAWREGVDQQPKPIALVTGDPTPAKSEGVGSPELPAGGPGWRPFTTPPTPPPPESTKSPEPAAAGLRKIRFPRRSS